MAPATKTRSATRKSEAGFSGVKHPAAGALAREGEQLDQVLHLFHSLTSLADEVDDSGSKKLLFIAWEQVDRADPIRVRFARELLHLSDHTITDWIHRGILEQRQERPRRLSLGSVLHVKQALEELREAGRDQELASALLNRIELGELQEDERFRSSLAQAKRGERGEWPEGW